MKRSGIFFVVLVLHIFTSASYSETAQVRRFAEVKITLDEQFALADAEALPMAPGSKVEVLEDGIAVKAQIPAAKVQQLLADSVNVEVERNFILLERADQLTDTGGGIIGATSCSGPYHYAENDDNYFIEDNVYWWPSYMYLSYIPAGYTVTCIDVYYEVEPSWSFIDVGLTDDEELANPTPFIYILEDYVWGGGGTIINDEEGITDFNGDQLSQTWYLVAYEYTADGSGYIDYWWIKLYYEDTGGYCSTSGGCYEHISRVEIGSIDNSSSCDGYADYTGLSTEMQIGVGYPIVVTNGPPHYETDECGIWVDWNQDEDFDDTDEIITVVGSPGFGPYTATITPPSAALVGSTRMRIRITDGSVDPLDINPCGFTEYGEVEDYTISVVAGGPTYGGGAGTPSDPYLIYTAEHLQTLGATPEHWDRHFKLMADIDLADYTGTSFNIIGTSDINDFNGTFRGENHSITNFTYDVSGQDYIGLFGCVSEWTCRIENLSIIAPDINASNAMYVGALIGRTNGADIAKCDVQGGSVRGENTQYLGGLIGSAEYWKVADCYATAEVEAESSYGGLAGRNYNCSMRRCYAAGRLIVSSPPIPSTIGGLVGEDDSGIYTDCFWDSDVASNSRTSVGTPKTTEEMHQQSTFTNWDFVTPVWVICEGRDYPRLNRPGFKYGGGKGTASEPYLIRSPCEMQDIGNNPADWDKHFRLIADINLADYTGEQFNMIGPFSGVFDGDGHSISGFNYSYTGVTQATIGIFSEVDGASAEIKNVVIVDANVDSGTQGVFTASLVGEMQSGTISNCDVQGGSITGETGFGLAGLVGNMFNGTIENCDCNIVITPTNGRGGGIVAGMWSGTSPIVSGCIFRGQVSGNDGAGGIVAENYGTIENCQVSGQVTAQQQAGGITGENHGIIRESFCDGQVTAIGSEAGGITGRNFDDIIDCYSSAQIAASSYTGGLVGLHVSGDVRRCYAAGPVVSSGGGLIASVMDGNTFDSFWDVETSGKSNSAGGTGLPTEQMYKQSTFSSAGWDFGGTWKICEDATYPQLQWQRYSGGDGSPNNPCLVCHAEEMQAIGAHREDWDKHFRLAGDVDMSAYTGTQYNLIGKYASASEGGGTFKGSFDGDGHTISSFSYSTTEKKYGVGLFGFVGSSDNKVEIKNLIMLNPSIDVGPGGDSGSLVGIFGLDTEIYNCHIINATIRGDGGLGGLVGSCLSGSVDKCSASVDIVATKGSETLSGSAGGLIGINNFTLISRCCSSGSVVSDGDLVGGLCGVLSGEADVNDCYSTASVDGNEYVGGLIGYNSGGVRNSYSVGPVSGSGTYVNGLCGVGDAVENCFWDVNTSGQAGPGPGIGLTTAEMQQADTFIAAGWDFVHELSNGPVDIWRLCEGNYAKLAWQLEEHDFVCPNGVEEEDFIYMCNQWLMEKCYFDIAPDEGDGFVDFLDYSVFADSWLRETGQEGFNPVCDVSPQSGDGKVDEQDANVFMDEWLKAGWYYLDADIAPSDEPDGIVNFLDYAIFCADWVTQISP